MSYIRLILGFFALSCVVSCTRLPCCYQVAGPDELVMDSYQLRQGKTAILEMMGQEVAPMPKDALEEYRDEIASGDVLNIALYHPTRKDLREAFEYINKTVGGFQVEEGIVYLPDIPPVEVQDLTVNEAQKVLRGAIQKHYQDAELFVGFKKRKRRKVELAGLVQASSIEVDGKMRLYELLGKAGIRPEANLFMSYVMRDGKTLPVDLYQLMIKGEMKHNLVMKGGDRIFIAPSNEAKVYVLGEVFAPKTLSVPYGTMPVTEAIVSAGGVRPSGDLCHIFVIRGDLACPKIYDITWEHVLCLPQKSLLLMPGDMVYVSKRPISRWNEFMSDILPTLSVINSVKDAKSVFLWKES